jgi:predicted MFS family arabinose efflux permease
VQSNSWGWGSEGVIGLLVVALVGLSAFAVVESRRRAPMVDLGFFRSRTFLGANIVAFIVSFAMLAVFFFLALYMQDILGYTPLQAGVRFLPSTVMIIVIAPMAGRLADRVGSRPLMTGGLLAVSFSLFWLTGITTHSSYKFLVVSFVALGIGMGFVMSPMSTAAMNSVDRANAGVASGILSMTRMVGGTFGVAAMGAVISTLGRSHLAKLLPALSAHKVASLSNALGAGSTSAGSSAPPQVIAAMEHTYVYALSNGLYVAGGVALLGAVVAWTLIARAATQPQSAVEGSASIAEPVHV